MKLTNLNKIVITSTLLVLGACSSSSSDNNNDTGTLSLNITDAPVDGATEVVVQFSGVTLKPVGGEDIEFLFDDPATTEIETKTIDLLKLQGTLSQPLLESVEIPAGDYSQIRLHVNAEFDSVMDSFITLSGGGQEELRVPSGSQNGLKLNTPFSVDASTSEAVYTIDFDLRKSIVNPVGQPGHFLKPSLRLVQNLDIGSISGTVAPALVTATECSGGNAVYVFAGSDATVDDIGSASEPMTSALVKLDPVDGYVYELGFMHAGEYTLAFTCQADQDFDIGDVDDLDGDANDNIVFFSDTINVTVEAGQETRGHNF